MDDAPMNGELQVGADLRFPRRIRRVRHTRVTERSWR